MTMMPVIDSLGATIPAVRLRNGLVDMATRTITAQSLAADSLDVAYITPSAEYLKTHGITTAADTLPENISASADSLLHHNRRPHHAQRTAGTIRAARCQAFAGV